MPTRWLRPTETPRIRPFCEGWWSAGTLQCKQARSSTLEHRSSLHLRASATLRCDRTPSSSDASLRIGARPQFQSRVLGVRCKIVMVRAASCSAGPSALEPLLLREHPPNSISRDLSAFKRTPTPATLRSLVCTTSSTSRRAPTSLRSSMLERAPASHECACLRLCLAR